MLLRDAVGDVAEAVLRAALQTDRGAYLSAVPQTLPQFGLHGYGYHPALSLAELQAATTKSPAIVAVKRQPDDEDAHALVIDRIVEQSVLLRDPLPEATGSAYQVTLEAFLSVWLRAESSTGRAVAIE